MKYDRDYFSGNVQSYPGLFVTGGLLSQSCIPNTRLYFDLIESEKPDVNGKIHNHQIIQRPTGKIEMTVYSARQILQGEKLTHCYLENVMTYGTQDRQKKLRERLIDCNCTR